MTADPRLAKVRQFPLTEAAYQDRIVHLAKLTGWLCCHYRPARTEQGWRTPLSGDPGGPDLILARRGVFLLWEVKSVTGKVRPSQQPWVDNGVRVVRPQDWDDYVVPTLKGQAA